MNHNLLTANDLKFSYGPQRQILHIESFTLAPSEKVFLYGPSGSGKTTFLNLCAGVLRPSSGELKLLDQDVSQLSLRQLDKLRGQRMGYIFQSFNLIPYLSVLENVLLPTKLFPKGHTKHELKERALHYLERLNLAEYIHQTSSRLSIGQQQRVAIARAFVTRPDLLIADEPTSSLDEENTADFMELLIEDINREKMGLFFVSHDRRLEKYFDRSLDLRQINLVKQEVDK